MGRREQRAEMQRTWSVYEPRVAGKPFAAKDLYDADERARATEVGRLQAARDNVTPPANHAPGASRRTYLPALAAVAVEERHKSTMPE